MNMSCFFREKFYHYFLFVAFFQVQQYMCTIFFQTGPFELCIYMRQAFSEGPVFICRGQFSLTFFGWNFITILIEQGLVGYVNLFFPFVWW